MCGPCQAKHGGAARARAIALNEPVSVVAWEGPSVFTGRPVRVVLTSLDGGTQNDKTGPMVQASVVQADGNASRHRGSERERDVCGDCPASKLAGGDWCYAVTMAWMLGQHAHRYPVVSLERAAELVRGKELRITAYGDPAAVPFEVWAQLCAGATGTTGYTHAWRTCDPRFRVIAMASTEEPTETAAAEAAGWRAFRTTEAGAPLLPSEVLCPNVTKGVTCADCGLCRGSTLKAKSVGMPVHGGSAGRFVAYLAAKRAPQPAEPIERGPMTKRLCACGCGKRLRVNNTTGYSGYCTAPRVTAKARSPGAERDDRVRTRVRAQPGWNEMFEAFENGLADYSLGQLVAIREAVDAALRTKLEASGALLQRARETMTGRDAA